MRNSETMKICSTCAVEYDQPLPEICPICADDRQWVPESGQQWTDLDSLREAGQSLTFRELEADLWGINTDPTVGIGQTSLLPLTAAGQLLWDPVGYVDDETVARIRTRGRVLAVAASHPHMFGVQVEWARALDAPVLVNARDAEWLGRRDDRVELWDESRELAEGLSLHRVGGHFPGSAIAVWAAGAAGKGVLLTGDSVFPNPDRRSIGFMRSYPNKLPLSAAVVRRLADTLGSFSFDRIYGNFANCIAADARAILEFSAQRHIAWVRGDHDDLT